MCKEQTIDQALQKDKACLSKQALNFLVSRFLYAFCILAGSTWRLFTK
jgi:hypothetical protein